MNIQNWGQTGLGWILMAAIWCSPLPLTSELSADTVYLQIEFSSGPAASYALTKEGSFRSGVEALTALLHALGGASQRFDEPFAPFQEPSGDWVQWWTWDFQNNFERQGPLTPSLTGLSLRGQTDGDWTSSYWALYTRNSPEDSFSFADIGLADLVPIAGTWIALKFSDFSGETPPPETSGLTPEAVVFLAPADLEPPRILSCRQTPGGYLEIIFSTVSGGTYQLETALGLQSPDWLLEVGPFVATSNTTSFAVQPQHSRKFYRLARILP